MDKEEAIKRIKDHIRVHHIGEYPHIKIAEALSMAISALATDTNVGNKWIPVTERLPNKMGQYVCQYVFGEQTEYPFYQVLWYFTAFEKPHFQHEGSMGLRVTHWMPLPEEPKEV